MARKKITLAFISNKTNRKASYRKRRRGLFKKVSEISTLCDVEACAVVFSPFDQKVEVWPSLEEAEGVLARYQGTSETYHRPQKELDLDSFTQQCMSKTQQKLDRLCNQNKRRDLELFMYRCMAGMNQLKDLDVCDWIEMDRTIDEEIRNVIATIEKFTIEGGGGDDSVDVISPVNVIAPPPLPPPVAPMGELPLPPPVAAMAPPPLPLTPPMTPMDMPPLIELESSIPLTPPMASMDMDPLTPLIEWDFNMLDWDLEALLYPY